MNLGTPPTRLLMALLLGASLSTGCNFITGEVEGDGARGDEGGDAGFGSAGGIETDGGQGGDTAGPPDNDAESGADGSTGSQDPSDDGAGSGGTSGGADSGAEVGLCCEAQPGPGCGDGAIETCVCAQDPYCCEQGWDADCAAAVNELGCGFCAMAGAPGESGCCTPSAEAGCSDAGIQTCVCTIDAACCEVAWDSVCVDLVTDGNCGDCGADRDAQPCCTASVEPGCSADPAVEQCVCDAAPECCSGSWTETCTEVATVLACAQCGPYPPEPLDCCDHGVAGGCLDDAVEACVCDVDPFCCSVLWDATCVAKVEDLACGTCA